MPVKIFQGADDLDAITLSFQLCQPLSSFHHLVQGLVAAELEQNVHVFRVLEEVLESHNVRVVQGSMNPDFTHQL